MIYLLTNLLAEKFNIIAEHKAVLKASMKVNKYKKEQFKNSYITFIRGILEYIFKKAFTCLIFSVQSFGKDGDCLKKILFICFAETFILSGFS